MIKKETDFNFYNPTRIYFRPNGLNNIGKIIKDDYNFKRIFLVYGSSSIKNGWLNTIKDSLKEKFINYREYTGISANPDIEDVLKMKEIIKDYEPELILAVGGGSIIDSCKLLAHLYYYEGNPLDFNKHVVEPIHALPVATVITLPASGSEMSSSCVISCRETGFKNGFNSDTNYPLFSLLDPTLTYTVSSRQASNGLVDMFSHSFERYFSISNEIEPIDSVALSVMKEIVNISKDVLEKLNDYQVKRALMILATIAHNGFTGFGKTKKFIVHRAEHYLSGKYPTLAHGQGIALLLPEFLILNIDNIDIYNKTLKMGEYCFNLKNKSFDDVIYKLNEWLYSLDIKHSFTELEEKISEEDIKQSYSYLKID